MPAPRLLPLLAICLALPAAAQEFGPAASWGGNVRSGPDISAPRIGSLAEGDGLIVVARTDEVYHGYPWFLIQMADGREGYQWGGIICGVDAPIEGAFGTCDGSATQADAERTGGDTTSPDPAAETGSQPRDCLLVVDGTTHVEGQCDVYPLGQGTYTLNTWSDGKPEQSHFAQVTALADGRFEATWNADPDDARAWDKIGEVTLREGCWVNDRVRICAR